MWKIKRSNKKPTNDVIAPALTDVQLRKKRHNRRIGAGVLIIVALIVLSLSARFAYRKLTVENPRFTFRVIKVSGGEFYEKNPEILAIESGLDQLQEMKINLFRIDLGAVQRRVEKLPKVSSCMVYYELPGTLHVEINERIPRAQIKQPKESKNAQGAFAIVADESGFLVPANRCSAELIKDLPVIGNLKVKDSLKPGIKLDELDSAMQLIMLTIRNFGDIKVRVVDMSNPDELQFWIDYGWYSSPGDPVCIVMPRDLKSMPLRLTALHSELYRNYPKTDNRKKWRYKLSYDGQIAIQPVN